MRKLLLAALATSVLVVAMPAFAHGDDGDDDWSAESYGDFSQQYQHIWDGIQHGLSDGSYTPRQARYYLQELRSVQARAIWENQRGGYDPYEINARLESLRGRMHIAHQRGHDRLNGVGPYGYYGGYGYQQPYAANPYRYSYGRRW